MALIKCNNCGRPVSDRANVCPHCGCAPHAAKVVYTRKYSESEENSRPTWPGTGEEVCTNTKNANRGLLGLVGVLTLIALVFAGFIVSGQRYYNGKTLKFTIDTSAVDTVSYDYDSYVDDTTAVVDPNAADTTYYSDSATTSYSNSSTTSSNDDFNGNKYAEAEEDEIVEEEIGFKSNTDVLDYVVGNSYSCNGITLRITDEAVYANGNKISTSKPVFRKLSLNKGIITARPSIFLTVIRDDNRLVDNNSGDSYSYW